MQAMLSIVEETEQIPWICLAAISLFMLQLCVTSPNIFFSTTYIVK